jgi:hypothetical protein
LFEAVGQADNGLIALAVRPFLFAHQPFGQLGRQRRLSAIISVF